MTEKKPKTIVFASNNMPYLIAVVAMTVVVAIAIIVVSIFMPNQDNTAIITAIVGLSAPTTLSLLAFMKSQETHLSVNSRLDDFMVNARSAARAEGVVEGQKKANERTDRLKEKKI